jgi:hypothetical protein
VVLPGVLTWEEYVRRRRTWDAREQAVGLDAQFWTGKDLRLFPDEWLDHCDRLSRALAGTPRTAEGLGVDPGEGRANTSLVAADRAGLFGLRSVKTPDTNLIPSLILMAMRDWRCPPEHVAIDQGGGGKQAADRLRAAGYRVRTVAFGAAVSLPLRHRPNQLRELVEQREDRYVYKNRRAEMYFEFASLCDPAGGGYAIPFHLGGDWSELRRQMAAIPKMVDDEGRYFMLPKGRTSADGPTGGKTLTDLIGNSPDELDGAVLAVHAVLHRECQKVPVGVLT